MGKVLIIGCGGVASVAIHKCCQNSEVFSEVCIASRTKSKCDALKEKLEGTTKTKITTAQVNADNVDELIALIEKEKPQVVLNLALPYQDLTIMDACLATKTHYVDTAKSRKIRQNLSTAGSGLTGNGLKKQESLLFWEAVLTRVSPAYFLPMP